jgi:hypothetical protein
VYCAVHSDNAPDHLVPEIQSIEIQIISFTFINYKCYSWLLKNNEQLDMIMKQYQAVSN